MRNQLGNYCRPSASPLERWWSLDLEVLVKTEKWMDWGYIVEGNDRIADRLIVGDEGKEEIGWLWGLDLETLDRWGDGSSEHGAWGCCCIAVSRMARKKLCKTGVQLAASPLRLSTGHGGAALRTLQVASVHRVEQSSSGLNTVEEAFGRGVRLNSKGLSSKNQNRSHKVQTCSVLVAVYMFCTLWL